MCVSTSRVEMFNAMRANLSGSSVTRDIALRVLRYCTTGLVIATTVNATLACATQLRSPWEARQVTLSHDPYDCPAVVHLSPDLRLEGYYVDAQSSIVDPQRWAAYAEASGPYRKLAENIVLAADSYRRTGSRAAANCALVLMTAAARDGIFAGTMSSRQDFYVQGWLTGAIAIAYLKVRDSTLVTGQQEKVLFPWFRRIVTQTKHFYRQGHAKNNHLYWAGVEIAAAGIATNDQKLFDWGVEAFQTGVEQIDANGTMPLEMRRGRRALHYHFYALAPLVYLADFGQANGLDLYAENHNALQRLVHFCISSYVDGSLIAKLSGASQETQSGAPAADLVSWAVIWKSQFHDPEVTTYLQKATSLNSLYLGGLPPGFQSTFASQEVNKNGERSHNHSRNGRTGK